MLSWYLIFENLSIKKGIRIVHMLDIQSQRVREIANMFAQTPFQIHASMVFLQKLKFQYISFLFLFFLYTATLIDSVL